METSSPTTPATADATPAIDFHSPTCPHFSVQRDAAAEATIRPLARPAPQAEVRQAAATTPGRIGKPSAVDALMATFNVPHLPGREQAVWALGEIASAWLAAGGNP